MRSKVSYLTLNEEFQRILRFNNNYIYKILTPNNKNVVLWTNYILLFYQQLNI
jgi:hypothetical protein